MIFAETNVWDAVVSFVDQIAPIVAAVGGIIVGVIGYRVRKDTKETNQAVNKRAPGEMKLIELAVDTNKLTVETNESLKELDKKFDEHIQWHLERSFLTREEIDEMIRAQFLRGK